MNDMDPRVAGIINPMWVAEVRLNGQEPMNLFATYGNWRDAEVDRHGSVRAGGRWLTQPEIDAVELRYYDERHGPGFINEGV